MRCSLMVGVRRPLTLAYAGDTARPGIPSASRRRKRSSCGEKRAVKRLSLAESGARVEAIVHDTEARFEHMRVDLRGREIGMTQHHLDRPQVGTALEQVRGE